MSASLRQLLVHHDASSHSTVRLDLARRLARRLAAELSVLYAATSRMLAIPMAAGVESSVGESLMAFDEERGARTRAVFDQTMQEPGASASWSEVSELTVTAAFVQQALYADLLVLGQQEPGGDEGREVPADFVEAVVVASGKPALVIPHVGVPSTLGERVVIAWKETRESARAVAAALPLLQQAEHVHVLSWGAARPAVAGAVLDLESYLRLHQIKPKWHRYDEEPAELGELLLSRTFDLGADLLVMGCYGHSRFREWVLGGASRTILRSMTLPVLMSH